MTKSFTALLLGVVLLSGCTIVRYKSPSLQEAPTTMSVKLHSMRFLWGLIPGRPVSLEQCGAGGIQKMKVSQGVVDVLVTALTVGIVEPVKVKITCAAPPNQAPPQQSVNVSVQPQPTSGSTTPAQQPSQPAPSGQPQ